MNFKKVAMMSIAVLGIIFLGCQGLKSYSEDELGLRKTTLFNENATIEAYDYSGIIGGAFSKALSISIDSPATLPFT